MKRLVQRLEEQESLGLEEIKACLAGAAAQGSAA
jgi:hypothetical protein